jgi:hypothetical protein
MTRWKDSGFERDWLHLSSGREFFSDLNARAKQPAIERAG